MVRPCGIVVAAASGIGKRIVSVINLLELLCAGGTFGRVSRDAVRVRFQGLAFVGVADLLLCRSYGDVQDSI